MSEKFQLTEKSATQPHAQQRKNRIEVVREYLNGIPLQGTELLSYRQLYVHLHGVSQACALLAKKRHENVELATITGLLHDIYPYTTGMRKIMRIKVHL